MTPAHESAGIGVVGADGSGERLLSPVGTWPSWSPDGTCIVFATGRGLRIVNADCGRISVLTSGVQDRVAAWQPSPAAAT